MVLERFLSLINHKCLPSCNRIQCEITNTGSTGGKFIDYILSKLAIHFPYYTSRAGLDGLVRYEIVGENNIALKKMN